MNERIRQIAEQSGAWEYYEINEGVDGDEKPLEKFAELIVRECMDVVSDESEKVSDEWRGKDGKHIWWKIKEHFGVEE